ncbi:Uncharacterized protein CK203_097479 [Vitis vinifera]|uniref:Uncharacterized protein n=1 Tax=Vitis vinifera TaxID=29760 RepID=A0A438D949_VITVI|nr:Uncharacterized protein CK203_097479 [Vitis vinifera]
MKTSLRKLRGFALHRQDVRERRVVQPLAQLDELVQATQIEAVSSRFWPRFVGLGGVWTVEFCFRNCNLKGVDMQDMRNCYDTLLSAAAATANSAYACMLRHYPIILQRQPLCKQYCQRTTAVLKGCPSLQPGDTDLNTLDCQHQFSESLKELGGCLLEKTALNEDEESGKVLLKLGKVQYELQKLVDSYRSHIFQTIVTPSESLLKELRTVEILQYGLKKSPFLQEEIKDQRYWTELGARIINLNHPGNISSFMKGLQDSRSSSMDWEGKIGELTFTATEDDFLVLKRSPKLCSSHLGEYTDQDLAEVQLSYGTGKDTWKAYLVTGERALVTSKITPLERHPQDSEKGRENPEKEMKRQCDEKRDVYEYMITRQREKGRSRSGRGETFSSHQVQAACDEYDEEATLFVFRLKSLKQGQSRSLLTQASRHHAAQLSFFRKALKSLEVIEPHVKLVTEQQHIDYKFSGLEDDDWDDGEDDDDYDGHDGDLSFDYGQIDREQDFVSTARNSMENQGRKRFPVGLIVIRKHSPPATFPANFSGELSGDGFFYTARSAWRRSPICPKAPEPETHPCAVHVRFFRPVTASHAPAHEGG